MLIMISIDPIIFTEINYEWNTESNYWKYANI